MSIFGSSELRYCQRIDAVIFGVGADKLDESSLPVEIKRDDQPVVSTLHLKPNALVIEALGFREYGGHVLNG